MEVRNENFAAYIDYFTTNTYVMVIMADATIRTFLCYYVLACCNSVAHQLPYHC